MEHLQESPVLLVVSDYVLSRYKDDRALMEQISEDIGVSKGFIRACLSSKNAIKRFDGVDDDSEIRVVDGSFATINAGEFSSLLALAVNVSTHNSDHLSQIYEHVFAPNSEAFGMVGSPVMAACELKMLAESWDGLTLYDGSFQGLNMNLGNLFRTMATDDDGESFLGEVTAYSDVLFRLFDEVVGDEREGGLYSKVFNPCRDDLIAVSKRNTSSYVFHRLQDPDLLDSSLKELGADWFKVPKSDRLLLGGVLNAGEYIGPIPFKRFEGKSGHKGLFGLSKTADIGQNKKLSSEFLDCLYFSFFKPKPWSPVLRLETIAPDLNVIEQKVQKILGILSAQSQIPGIVEPVGLWLADKIAKQVHSFREFYGSANGIFYPELFKPNRTEEI